MVRITGFLCLLALTLPAAGQDLSIVATEPAAGDSSVALQTTVEFTLSAPLDTTARFSGETPFEFFAISPPDSIRIDSTSFSDDLTTLRFDVTHTDSTDFVWILTGAVSQDGRPLCQSYVLSYTTADRPGQFSVSGRIYEIIALKGGVVCDFGGLFATLWNALPDSNGHVVAAVVATQEFGFGVGDFVVEGVRAGAYWVASHIVLEGLTRPLQPYHFYGRPDSLVVADSNRTGVMLSVDGSTATERTAEVPGVAALLPNYPNPFNPQTTLSFRLERPARLYLTIHDLLGRQVATVANGFYPPGTHEVLWHAVDLPNVMYAAMPSKLMCIAVYMEEITRI